MANAPTTPIPGSGDGEVTSLRGQIYRAGISIAVSVAFLVGGFSLAFGVEELTAVGFAMTCFLVIGVAGWVADLVVGPSLEQVAQQRAEERAARERELAPAAGGVLPAALVLSGGAAPPAGDALGVSGSAGGRTSGAVIGGRPPATGAVAGALRGRSLDVTLPEEGVASPGRGGAIPPVASPVAPAEEFQDLASLLRESAQPPPVPVRTGRQAGI